MALARMSRFGEGTEGFARSLAVATVAPGGTFAVGGALVLDEVADDCFRLSIPFELEIC